MFKLTTEQTLTQHKGNLDYSCDVIALDQLSGRSSAANIKALTADYAAAQAKHEKALIAHLKHKEHLESPRVSPEGEADV